MNQGEEIMKNADKLDKDVSFDILVNNKYNKK